MKKSRILTFLICLFTISNLFGQSEFNDSIIIRLIKKADNKSISKYAKFKMNETPIIEHKLYYNNILSQSFFSLQSYDTAMIYAINGLKMINLVDDSNLICKAWYQAALLNLNFNKYDSSLHYILKSLNCANNNNFKKSKAKACNLIGVLMGAENNYKSAINFFKIACKQYLKINDTFSYSSSLLNLGYSQFSSGDTINGIINLKKSIKYLEDYNKFYDIILSYLCISEYYLGIKNFNEFNKYINLATETAKRSDDKESLAKCYYTRAIGCLFNLDYNGAINYATKSRTIHGNIYIQNDSVLSIAYEEIGDNSKALVYQKAYIRNYIQLFKKEQTEKLNKLSIEYSVKEKDLLIENQLLEINKRKNNLTIALLILGLMFLIILSISVIKYIKNRNKEVAFSNLLKKDKELIEEKEYLSWQLIKQKNKTEPNILENKNSKLATDSNLAFESNLLYNEMRDLFEKKKLYLNPNLLMEDIIKELGTNKTYLYAAMKLNTEDNFRALLNKYRVNEAKNIINNLINDMTKIIIEDVQINAGFNSSASFFRAFKENTGLTPMEFTNQVKLTKNHIQ